MSRIDFTPLFRPRVIAVAGMSTTKKAPANRFVQDLRAFGFDGSVYAVHPTAEVIDGVPVLQTLADVPEPVDYAYVAVAAHHLPGLLRSAAGRVKFAQVMSSGFAEAGGEDGLRLQEAMLDAAKEGGVRVLGPNCLGTYSPQGKVTFISGAPEERGTVGLVSQSGGLAIDFIRRGAHRGIRFSGVVTVGNSADVNPTELLEYYLDEPDTSVIGLYLENCRRGRDLFELLQRAQGRKPVVILKGGRSEQGSRAAASHTGALASNDRIWVALGQQTGAILVDSLEDFLDMIAVLQHLSIRPGRVTRDVALVGNGGGTSVLASDAFARHGLTVAPLAQSTVKALEDLGLPPGTSVLNPVDTPATTVVVNEGRVMRDVLSIVAGDSSTDAVVVHVNLGVLVPTTDNPSVLLENVGLSITYAKGVLPAHKHLLAVLRSDGDPVVEDFRRRLALKLSDGGIPVLPELSNAARVLGELKNLEEVLARRVAPVDVNKAMG